MLYLSIYSVCVCVCVCDEIEYSLTTEFTVWGIMSHNNHSLSKLNVVVVDIPLLE
jgi:hypothetical protein